MAIDTLSVSDRLSGGGVVQDTGTGDQQGVNFGAGVLPDLRFGYSFGTGDSQANKWYARRRTLAATTYDDLNLTSGLTTLGATQAFTALKRVVIAIVDPDGTKRLRVGPQGRTNAAQLWFQAATTNFWEETYSFLLKERPVTGWALTAGAADVLSVYNPTGSSVTYAIWLLGTG